MRPVHVFLLAMTFCLFTAHAATKDTKRSAVGVTKQASKVALVIGNKNYEVGELQHTIEDARAMRDFLKNKAFSVVYAENADKRKMDEKIDTFINRLKGDGVALVYYSGHGIQEYSKKAGGMVNYLIPTDNDKIKRRTDLDYKAVSLNYLLDSLVEKHNKLNIVMVDACRTPFRSYSMNSRQGLAPASATGVFIAYATASGETAEDDGLFRISFIKHAKEAKELSKVFDDVQDDVYAKSGQTPFVVDGVRGEFYFTQATPKPEELIDYKQHYTAQQQRIAELEAKLAQQQNNEAVTPVTPVSPRRTATSDDVVVIGNLMWQNQPYDAEDKKHYDDNTEGGKTWWWKGADTYCKNLTIADYDDWRLPTKEELKSLLTKEKHENGKGYSHYIRPEFVEKMPPLNGEFATDGFWSSTESNNASYAWRVRFGNGDGSWGTKSNSYFVRCVRGGQ